MSISISVSEELHEKLKEVAERRGVPMAHLVEQGTAAIVLLPERAWDKLKFYEERTSRHLTPAQQVVDLLCRKFSAPLVKWGRG